MYTSISEKIFKKNMAAHPCAAIGIGGLNEKISFNNCTKVIPFADKNNRMRLQIHKHGRASRSSHARYVLTKSDIV